MVEIAITIIMVILVIMVIMVIIVIIVITMQKRKSINCVHMIKDHCN